MSQQGGAEKQHRKTVCEACADVCEEKQQLDEPIFLHAFRYSWQNNWSFESKKPLWLEGVQSAITDCSLLPPSWNIKA